MATTRDNRNNTGVQSWAMPLVRVAALACLIGVPASGCSLSEPAPRDFSRVDQKPARAKEPAPTLEEAKAACKEETRRKGIASVIGIMSRLRRGSADEDYIACMKARGYEVEP